MKITVAELQALIAGNLCNAGLLVLSILSGDKTSATFILIAWGLAYIGGLASNLYDTHRKGYAALMITHYISLLGCIIFSLWAFARFLLGIT